MSSATFSKQTLLVGLLSSVAIGLLIVIFYSPVWWVSLTAPNYPAEAFPDGVRIHFHFNGNQNRKVEIRSQLCSDFLLLFV